MAKKVETQRSEEGIQHTTNKKLQEGRMENHIDKDGRKSEDTKELVGATNTGKPKSTKETTINNVKLRQRLPRRAKTQRNASPLNNDNLQKSIAEHFSSLGSVGTASTKTTSTSTTTTSSTETSTTTPKLHNKLGNQSPKNRKSHSDRRTTTDFLTKKIKIEKMDKAATLARTTKRRKGAELITTKSSKSIIQNLGNAIFSRTSKSSIDTYKHLSKLMTNEKTFSSSDEEENLVNDNKNEDEMEMEVEIISETDNNKTNEIKNQEVIIIDDEEEERQNYMNKTEEEDEDVKMEINENNTEKGEETINKNSINEGKKKKEASDGKNNARNGKAGEEQSIENPKNKETHNNKNKEIPEGEKIFPSNEIPNPAIKTNEKEQTHDEEEIDGSEKSPKRQRNITHSSKDWFECHEPPTNNQNNISKLTLEAKNKEGVDQLNQNTQNLTLADSNKEGLSSDKSNNDLMDPTIAPLPPKHIQDQYDEQAQKIGREMQIEQEKAKIKQTRALRQYSIDKYKKDLEDEKKILKARQWETEQCISELDSAQLKLNDEIRDGQNSYQKENKHEITTKEVDQLRKEISGNTSHKLHEEHIPEGDHQSQSPKPSIHDEKDNFWKEIWSPGIDEPGPDVKQKAEFVNIISESYEKFSDPQDIKNYQQEQGALLPDTTKILYPNGSLQIGYFQNPNGKLCHRKDPEELIPITRAEYLRYKFLQEEKRQLSSSHKNNTRPDLEDKHVSFFDQKYEEDMKQKGKISDRIQQFKAWEKHQTNMEATNNPNSYLSNLYPEIRLPSKPDEEGKNSERKERSKIRKEHTSILKNKLTQGNNTNNPPNLNDPTLSEEDKARLQRQDMRDLKMKHCQSQQIVFGSGPNERSIRAQARLSTIIYEMVCQLVWREGTYHEDDTLDHLFDCTKELELNDDKVTFLPVEKTPEEEEQQLTTQNMLELLKDAKSLYETTIRKYIHFKDSNGLIDENTGKVYLKIRLRLGRPVINRTEARKYTRQIRDRWARKNKHEFKFSEVQQMNQYKIGFFSNISKGSKKRARSLLQGLQPRMLQ